MKVSPNFGTNPVTQPVRPPQTPIISNTQLSPSGSPVRKGETPGILSQMFPPLHRYHLLPRQGTPSTAYCHVTLCDALIALLFILFHLHYFFLVEPETVGAPSSTMELTTPPSCQSNQASPPIDHQISPILLSTACIRVVQHVTVRLLLFCWIACQCCYSH